MRVDLNIDYGKMKLDIEGYLEKKGLSKNRICTDLGIPRTNFNRYCRGDFQRIDEGLICKLCWYLDVTPGELIKYEPPELKVSQVLEQAIS